MSEFLVRSNRAGARKFGTHRFFCQRHRRRHYQLAAAEHSSAVLMAMPEQNGFEPHLVALGSSLQIALFVAPILIFASYLFGRPMNLGWNFPEVVPLSLRC